MTPQKDIASNTRLADTCQAFLTGFLIKNHLDLFTF